MLTLLKARKILGKLSKELTDEELNEEIKTANLLKDLFFYIYKKNSKKVKSNNSY